MSNFIRFVFLPVFIHGSVSILFFLGGYENYCIDFAKNMKKGNSVTRKVRQTRRIGGNISIHKHHENSIKKLPGTPRRPPPRIIPSTELRENGPGDVNRTLSLLTSLYGRTSPSTRNGGKTYKNKYKTKTPNNLKPKPKLP